MNEFKLTRDQAAESYKFIQVKLLEAYAREKRILDWGKLLFPEKFSLPFCKELHEYLISIRNEPFTNTEAPRGHAKTTIQCFLIPIFQALEEPQTFRHYLNVQATMDKALSINRTIRTEFETNPLLLMRYGNMVGSRWTDQQFVLKNGVIFTAIGAGQSLRGLNYRNARPDNINIDDLYDEEDINNPEATEKKNSWFWGSLYPARSQSRRSAIHLTGTAINREDLLERLKVHSDIKSRTFRAIKDYSTGEVLWPELNTIESLERDREKMGSVIFYREMQNERRIDSESIVKLSWLTNWEYDPLELRRKFNKHFFLAGSLIGNDPSIGKKVENDFTGTALVVETMYDDGTGKDYWIEGLWNEKLSLDARRAQLESIAKGRQTGERITKVKIEAIAGFNDYADEVIRRTNLPVQRVNWVKDKISTLESKSHFFENGKVHLNKNIDPKLKDMLIYQLTTNHPRHDDLRDALLLCLEDSAGLWNFV